jgi:hypothetical protein
VTVTVYGQPLPPNRCEVHPDVAEEWPCVLCQNAALEHAESMLDEAGSPYRWSDGTPVDAAELAAQVDEDRRFDLLADEHGEDCCDE